LLLILVDCRLAEAVMVVLKKGADVELLIEKASFGGKGVARLNGFVVFVQHAIPGQRVLARIIRKKKAYAEARVLSVLEESDYAILPRCSHFGSCGGCLWQNVPYARQLDIKRQLVFDCLAHIGGLAEHLVRPVRPSPQVYYYRNKMEFSFGDERWLEPGELKLEHLPKPRNFALGLHVRGRFNRVLDLEECHLQHADTAEILAVVRQFARTSGLPPYNSRDHTGFWRFLVVRHSRYSDTMMVEIITAPHRSGPKLLAQLAAMLQRRLPAVATIVHGVSAKKAQIASADSRLVLCGPGYLEERLGSLCFRISPGAFFQTNTSGAEILVQEVLEAAGLSGVEEVWDLYCGTGALTLHLASRAGKVVGFEIVPQAVVDACANARLNNLTNCEFVVGDMRALFQQTATWSGHSSVPEVVVTDPPRAGMHPKVVRGLLELGPPRIVYVSCNPATLARDLKLLQEQYRLHHIQPVDLFPHTAHIEVVALLARE